MDNTVDSQATQQATQNAFDPRRLGQQNTGFSDEDISDIICLLYPRSEAASREVQRIVADPRYARHTTGRYCADSIDADSSYEDDAGRFNRILGIGDHALVLRLSSPLKDPSLGFTFGRNLERCDINFAKDPHKRLSNIHFRIYVNVHGSVLLEDRSMNGTVVDGKLLRTRPGPTASNRLRTLESGSEIKIVMHERQYDLTFRVRIPRREGEYEDAFMRNLDAYLQANGVVDDDDLNKTIGPGPSGHVNLFSPTKKAALRDQAGAFNGLQRPSTRLPREWRGGEKYARIRVIGKGAFATVHKVTSKFNGLPYAAKELDKRKFMKNGVLDQKVENEMKIMQKVNHPNIVQYIEHFDWDTHHFIIIMEFVPGGDLGRYIQDNHAIPEPHTKIIADQLVDALGYLHENKITHRDVKPDNVLIHGTNPLVVKLTDFGLSKMIDTEQTFLKTFCGTLLYCAPEVYTDYASYDDSGRRTNRRIRHTQDRERYDHAVDIWSLGGVLFYTLTGSPPFPVSSGTSHTELLDHIIKTPLNTSPLIRYNVSATGIEFLSRMIHVRPETRATITELKSHAWLAHAGYRTNQDSDDALGQSASQLSLDDRQDSQLLLPASQPCERRLDYVATHPPRKENGTCGQPRPPRLFGEVSVAEDSDAISEQRLNLPLSATSFDETEHDAEIPDSLEDSMDFATPRQKARLNEDAQLFVHKPSPPESSHGPLPGVGSQDPAGASSILENLNMKSHVNADLRATSQWVNSLATSKRKPIHDTSDEHETNFHKRLKSQRIIGNTEDEDTLFAYIPKMNKSDSGRQIDYPLPKTIYWNSRDESTWHLDYPEMTHLQYIAFEIAAEKRNEVFGPGSSPLWKLAMKYFPPTHGQRKEESSNAKLSESYSDIPSTATSEVFESQVDSRFNVSVLDDKVPSALTMSHLSKTEVGLFKSAVGSTVRSVSIPIQDAALSWGRGKTNTVVYGPAADTRVPKQAFRLLLWREGYTASDDEFRPWEPQRVSTSRTVRFSPEPDSFAFYIATNATNGIHINAKLLLPYEPKKDDAATATAKCRSWMRLYHGDQITLMGGKNSPAKLTFECFWGGSSATRPANEPPTCVPESLAQKLDRLWPKALRSLERLQAKEKAQLDQEIRMRNMLREQELSRVFEQRRLEATQRLEEPERRFREYSETVDGDHDDVHALAGII